MSDDSPVVLDSLALARRLYEAVDAVYEPGMPRWAFHRALQQQVAQLASEYGAVGRLEHAVCFDDGTGGRQVGRLDVVWLDAAGALLCVFEIDSAARRKSVRKLLALPAPYRFWLYYGQRGCAARLRALDPRGTIYLVDASYVRLRRGAKPME